jgi:hypothetical protein
MPAHTTLHASQSNIELQLIVPGALRDKDRTIGGRTKAAIDPVEVLPQPLTTVSVVERWNHSKGNIYRTFATLFAFMAIGANDAAYRISSSALSSQPSSSQQPRLYLPISTFLL